ncbi:MAG TPA: hypothetical protein VES67_08105 [Vicinamibacterales bacterium]|nr:hypothetical protein [Vicinamibacterales bacterium]
MRRPEQIRTSRQLVADSAKRAQALEGYKRRLFKRLTQFSERVDERALATFLLRIERAGNPGAFGLRRRDGNPLDVIF